jgi:hypothetical protein
MKKIILAAVLIAVSMGANAQIAYPGSTWGELTFDPSVVDDGPENNNILFQGAIQQGIDWKKYGAWTLNTYVGASYVIDKNELFYNNRFSPQIGVKLKRAHMIAGAEGQTEVGLRLVHQRTFRGVSVGQPKSGTGVQAYAQYWFGWNPKK